MKQTSLLWSPLVAIAAAAFAVEIPFFFFGTPSGHDVEFHLYSWLEVLGQWKHGILFPRWAALAQFGYGEPRFLFYPPASWALGGLISAVFPWTAASPIYIWIVLVFAGASMFALSRRWLGRRDAIFAAVFYAVNPYHLVIIYWRSAFAELLAACLVPLLVLCVLKLVEERARISVPLALVLAAAWLTNAPAAVMIHYSLALLIAFFAWRKRSPRILLAGGMAILLGACVAAFYLLPAIYEQKWITIGEAISAGSRPADNFLFIHTTDVDHDKFNHIISWVAMLEMGVTAAAAFFARSWRRTEQLWDGLAAWGVACSVLMFSVTLALWDFLPKLEFMQFPWRWLLCLSVVCTIFVTIGFKSWWIRAVLCLLAILVIVTGWQRVQSPWWDNAADLREMQDNMATGAGYEGVDEYTPVGADPAAIDKDARKVTVDGAAHAAIRVLRWDAESKIFTAQMSAADRLALKLFPYPAWEAEVNGREVKIAARAGLGQMLVPVEAGANVVEMKFVRTWDRTAGGWISVVAIIAIIVWVFIVKRAGVGPAESSLKPGVRI